jgi:hypothetical protein
MSWYTSGPPYPGRVVTDDVSYREAVRIGRYLELTRKLREGRITPADFRARVRRWRPVAGMSFLSDPRRVLALLQLHGSDDLEFYSTRGLRGRAA